MESKVQDYSKLDALLLPLGFHSGSRPGIYAQESHPWYPFDLTAVDQNLPPKVIMQMIMDMLWDYAVEKGRDKQKADIRLALGLEKL